MTKQYCELNKMDIKPGIGIGQIKFGISEEQLIAILGKPIFVKEGEYIEKSGDYSRELFYQKDLSFTFDTEDSYRLGLITIRNSGHLLYGRDLIGLPMAFVKSIISKKVSEIPKYKNWSHENALNHISLDYDKLGLCFWFDNDLLDEIQCSYLFHEDGDTVIWPK
jgi:hypothetical protein